jgi:hypothetical protein
MRIRRPALAPLAWVGTVAACGARTGLLVPELPSADDASVEAKIEGGVDADESPQPADAQFEAEFSDGDDAEAVAPPADAQSECSPETVCDPNDLEHVYRCGVPVVSCGSLEQCEQRAMGAECINPCLDSLGNDTSNGCEFYAVEMDTVPEAMGVCYAVFIVNEWKTGEPAKIEVSRGAQSLPIADFARIPAGKGVAISYAPYDPSVGLPANQVAILFSIAGPERKERSGSEQSPRLE